MGAHPGEMAHGTLNLIGREQDFDRLWNTYITADSGRMTAVMLMGEPGLGKVHPTQYPHRAECSADGGGDRH